MSRLEDRRKARDGLKRLAPARAPLVAAVDLGAAKVSCFILKNDGVRTEERTVHVAGAGYVASRGVRGASIINMEDAAQAIAMAVERAEAAAGVSVSGVTVTTAGGQLSSCRVKSAVTLGSKPIGDDDLTRAISIATAQVRTPGRRPIHVLPVAWSVDGAKGVRDPRAMYGRNLELELLVVTMNESAFNTLGHCLGLAHLEFQGVVAAPFAASLAALDDDEMDLGCACIDMGSGSTSTAVWSQGSLVHVDTLPVGGGHVTADIARGWSTSLSGAERLKTLHGSALASFNEDREMIEAPPRGDEAGTGPVQAPRSLLKGIIAPRIEETFELVRERLRASGAVIDPGAGIVLTGGASQLAGVREVAQRVFDRPVRLGGPKRAPSLAQAAAGPAFCAAAGVLQRSAFGPREAVSPKRLNALRAPVEANANPVVRVATWLRENL
jgi:cell division protein FtsA